MTDKIQFKDVYTDFIKKLRVQTATYHTELEEAGLSSKLMDTELTIETYKKILIAFYGFIIPAEKHYYTNLQHTFPRLANYKRGGLLEQDLLFLGLSKNDINNLPQFMGSPFIKTSDIIGCLYVLEGSKLGGQMISKHVKHKLKFIDEEGSKFFSAHGAETGYYWKEFIDILSRFAVDTIQEEAIIDGAQQTFENFGKWLKSTNLS